ncbi:UDP-glucuronosyl/UDP-glucosyltransferase [Artemisia annua]|uniref:UDP-glucuronosyl/UDP-glucosyltransferase n=1 Tax=Artemisia annua TaxID=35608 RepID=A0A2U1LQ05_ARTAN|nr:UDP-glucuronosyl/UDP-glucosyltransferase [Artemisia annua]
MDSLVTNDHKKPHVIFVPYPAQSHVKAMLKLAELLHHKGLQITFVNTDNIHKRMLKSGGPHCLDGSSDFRFETFPDSIPRNSEEDDASELILPYVETTFLAPFLDLAAKLPNPPTCIVSDGFVSCFTVDAAKKLGIPIMLYWTLSACGFMGIFHVHSLTEKGLAPPKAKRFENQIQPLNTRSSGDGGEGFLVVAVGRGWWRRQGFSDGGSRESVKTKRGLKSLMVNLRDQTTVIVGPSGVGKSSLINALGGNNHRGLLLDDSSNSILRKNWLDQASARIRRQEHATPHVSLLPLCGGGYLADTPGFNLPSPSSVTKGSLALCFPEMRKRWRMPSGVRIYPSKMTQCCSGMVYYENRSFIWSQTHGITETWR